MKRTFISIAVFLAIQSCSPKIYPSRTETTDHTITVTETVHDTIIQVRPDSSIVQALIQCDSAGRAHIEEIRTLKQSARIQQTLRIDNNLLTSRVKIDSMGIYLSYKERFKEDIKTENIETIIEKPVNYLTWYQKLLVAIGLFTIIILLPLGLFKLSKKFFL